MVLYHCISSYPVENEMLYLLEIKRLIDCYGKRIHGIGFSGHHKGISADIAALTLGAEFLKDILLLIEHGRGQIMRQVLSQTD